MINSCKSLDRFCLKDKVVVVTGGTGLLGALYCERLSEAGATVIIADLCSEKCGNLASVISLSTGVKAYGLAVDLSNEQSVINWSKKIISEFACVDVLINNAAAKVAGFFASLDQFSVDDWNSVMSVNVTGAFLACREIGADMARRGKGSIINISSIYGLVGPDQRIYEGSYYGDMGGAINTPLVYSASKGAIISMTRYLATYWGPKGVRSNTMTPGGVYTGQNDIFQEKYSQHVPMARMGKAEEMVGALLFLASDASSYINGQNIIVDGGWTAW
ncbi:MAG: SDR family oxidoreductase [Negativicutes bacterium]|jgi:NAD(P)-dependent dehydrogenase (short-subunit alcohol dehydrogenase family)